MRTARSRGSHEHMLGSPACWVERLGRDQLQGRGFSAEFSIGEDPAWRTSWAEAHSRMVFHNLGARNI